MRVWKSAIGLVLAMSVMAAVLGFVAAGGAAPASLTFSLTGAPSFATQGQNVSYRGTISNTSSHPVTRLTLVERVPGATLVTASFSHPVSCNPVTGGVLTCDLGTLAAHASIAFTKVYKTPATGASLVDTSSVSFREGGRETTRCANTTGSRPCGHSVTTALVSPANPSLAGGYALTTCTGHNNPTLSTNQQVGAGNQVATSVCVPNLPLGNPLTPGLAVEIAEGAGTFNVGVTETSSICIPAPESLCGPGVTPFVFSQLATFTFRIANASLPHGEAIDKVFRDGVLVSSSPNADPRVASITVAGGVTTVVAQSSTNGEWTFG